MHENPMRAEPQETEPQPAGGHAMEQPEMHDNPMRRSLKVEQRRARKPGSKAPASELTRSPSKRSAKRAAARARATLAMNASRGPTSSTWNGEELPVEREYSLSISSDDGDGIAPIDPMANPMFAQGGRGVRTLSAVEKKHAAV